MVVMGTRLTVTRVILRLRTEARTTQTVEPRVGPGKPLRSERPHYSLAVPRPAAQSRSRYCCCRTVPEPQAFNFRGLYNV